MSKRLKSCCRSVVAFFASKPQAGTLAAVALMGAIFYSAFPAPAMAAWDANAAALGILEFLKTLIIVGAAATAVMMVFRSQIIPAIIVVIAAALLYVVLTPDIMQSIGEGLKALFKFSG